MLKLTGKDNKLNKKGKAKLILVVVFIQERQLEIFVCTLVCVIPKKSPTVFLLGLVLAHRYFGSKSLRGDKAMSTFTMDFITSVYIVLYYFFVFFN